VSIMASLLPNPPSLVQHKGKKFLIFDAPNDDNLALYIKEFKAAKVVCVARACEPTYAKERLEEEGIQVEDLAFADGSHPSKDVVQRWVSLVKSVFKSNKDATIGVHCVAGLGRAPVLVAIALVEDGMDPINAVEFIRSARRGSINSAQLSWLKDYKPKKGGCAVM